MTVLQDLSSIDVESSQLGYYKSGEQKFANKHQALLHATANSIQEVTYHWFDDVFDNFDRSKVGTYSLNELYLKRALQLRESYDYLILNYSGGADSWNILKLFLDNNIKLEHIMVSWPISAVNAGLYTPSKKDVSARNFMSEWDFTMKPDLDWIAANYPEIKIERPLKFGGNLTLTYNELVKIYTDGKLHPLDLKNAVIFYLNEKGKHN